MNLLNEKLAGIRREIKVYEKQAKETDDQQELWDISKKIESLHKEESKILNEIGVLDSNESFYR